MDHHEDWVGELEHLGPAWSPQYLALPYYRSCRLPVPSGPRVWVNRGLEDGGGQEVEDGF